MIECGLNIYFNKIDVNIPSLIVDSSLLQHIDVIPLMIECGHNIHFNKIYLNPLSLRIDSDLRTYINPVNVNY